MLQLGLGAAIGAALGFSMAVLDVPEDLVVPYIMIALGSLFISVAVHAVIHEGGHLVCGLLSGYKFVSFRVGSIIWIKTRGKVYRKRFSIPGTAGQCLLDPPDFPDDGKLPCVLYNLGGGLANLLASALALATVSAVEIQLVQIILIAFALSGIYLGVINLIPLKAGGIANDGYNIKAFRSGAESAHALWIQARVNRMQSDGLRLSEMPAYFEVAEDTGTGNENGGGDPLIDAIKVLRFQRFMDERSFDEARACGAGLLKEPKMLELYKNVVRTDMLFLELIGECRESEVERLYSKAMQKYLKMVKGYPSAWRVKYAYAVCAAHDGKQAAEALRKFEKVLEKYPMEGEIRMEKELIEEVKDESLLL